MSQTSMTMEQEPGSARVEAGALPPWRLDELPAPPPFRYSIVRLVGPGLMMAGAAIGGGEWLTGPATTAQYGAVFMWLATLSIFFQAIYNIEAMRYPLYCGETIFVGYFRTPPGPRFWTLVYLTIDFGAVWPYLSANAAVPLVAVILGHLPNANEAIYVQWASYCVFLGAVVPLVFGGKIYTVLERIMVAKIFLVLGYLLFIGFLYVDWSTWKEIFLGFVQIGRLPVMNGEQVTWDQVLGSTFGWRDEPAPIDLALLGAFAAIAGSGGLTNLAFSSYAREKGWGMGSKVGAVPSIVGGKGIALSHFGSVFPITEESLGRWRRWMNILWRDQFGIWVWGCVLGMGIPSLVSLQFVRGKAVEEQKVAAMTAEAIVESTGQPIFWGLTLFCGFLVLAPSQVATMDGFIRRWTDVLWTGHRRLRHWDGDKVAYVYFSLLLAYTIWGLFVLTVLPKPLTLVKVSGVLLNFGLGASALHSLWSNCTLLPKEVRPGWLMRIGLVGCAVFFLCVSVVSIPKAARDLGLW